MVTDLALLLGFGPRPATACAHGYRLGAGKPLERPGLNELLALRAAASPQLLTA